MKEYEEFYETFPDSYTEKEYRKIVGAYLQHMCLKENMSLNFVSQSLNINKGVLSKVVNGKTRITPEIIATLTSFAGTEFHNDEHSYILCKLAIQEFIDAYLNLNYQRIDLLFEQFFAGSHILKHSPGYFHYQLLRYFECVSHRKPQKETEELRTLITRYKKLYTKEEYIFFILFQAENAFNLGQLSKALDILNTVESFLDGDVAQSNLLALIHQEKSIIYLHLTDGFRAYVYAKRAFDILSKTTYFRRTKYLMLTMADCHSLMGNFEMAQKKCIHFLQHIDQKDTYFQVRVLDKLSICYIRNQMYAEGLYYANCVLTLNPEYELAKLHKVIALLYSGEKDMCLKYCEEVLASGITSIYYKDFIELVYYALSKKIQKSIQLIRKIITTGPNKELRYKILDALMDYYKDNTEVMVFIQQEYIRILKSQ